METETRAPAVRLEWSRLLGFDQAVRTVDHSAAEKLNDPRVIKLGAKFGCKLGGRRPDIVDIARAR
jgi:hypothetical protein